MKKSKNIILILLALMAFTFTGCEKDDDDTTKGLPEYENYYYAGFLPWDVGTTLTKVSVLRSQTTLVQFQIQFHSAYVRNYDSAIKYKLVTTGIAAPAVLGQDFNIVDANGTTINPVNGEFTLAFPESKAQMSGIYVKLLNSALVGTRSIEIDLVKNETSQYTVGTFSQAYRRLLEIR